MLETESTPVEDFIQNFSKETPTKKIIGQIIFATDMHGVTQDYTSVQFMEDISKKYKINDYNKVKFYYLLFGEIPEEYVDILIHREKKISHIRTEKNHDTESKLKNNKSQYRSMMNLRLNRTDENSSQEVKSKYSRKFRKILDRSLEGKKILEYMDMKDIPNEEKFYYLKENLQSTITPDQHTNNVYNYLSNGHIGGKKFLLKLKNFDFKAENVGEKLFTEYSQSIKLNEEYLQIVDYLKEQGIKRYIITDRLRYACEAAYVRYLKDRFDDIILSSHMIDGVLKSKSTFPFETFKKIAAKSLFDLIELPKNTKIVFVDDSQKNLNFAKQAGLETILYRWDLKQNKLQNKENITKLVQSLKKLLNIEGLFEISCNY